MAYVSHMIMFVLMLKGYNRNAEMFTASLLPLKRDIIAIHLEVKFGILNVRFYTNRNAKEELMISEENTE